MPIMTAEHAFQMLSDHVTSMTHRITDLEADVRKLTDALSDRVKNRDGQSTITPQDYNTALNVWDKYVGEVGSYDGEFISWCKYNQKRSGI